MRSGPGLRQRTAACPQPLGIYAAGPYYTSASVEVAQTSGGCDSHRAGPAAGETGTPARSRQPAAALGAGITALGGRCAVLPPRGGGRRAGPRGSSGSTTCQYARIAVNGSRVWPLLSSTLFASTNCDSRWCSRWLAVIASGASQRLRRFAALAPARSAAVSRGNL
jgi:hypothetical protein